MLVPQKEPGKTMVEALPVVHFLDIGDALPELVGDAD